MRVELAWPFRIVIEGHRGFRRSHKIKCSRTCGSGGSREEQSQQSTGRAGLLLQL